MTLDREHTDSEAFEVYLRFKSYQIRNNLSAEEFREVLMAMREQMRSTIH